jgi:hypothetical protein
MKSLVHSFSSKAALLLISLALSYGTATTTQARDRNPLRPGALKTGKLDCEAELPKGYLKVYSVSDEFNDGAYYRYSSYAIYSVAGRLFKTVENSIADTEEIIPWAVALPVGSYTIVGYSARLGKVPVHFVIKPGQRTIVDLDLAEQEMYRTSVLRRRSCAEFKRLVEPQSY